MSDPFVAEIKIFAGNFAPRGYAFCEGQLLPIAQNTALFSLIGTTYGGDGETTTGLPNLKGRAAMHPGSGPGLTSRRLGETGGQKTVTLSMLQLPSHTHNVHARDGSPTSGVLANTGAPGDAAFAKNPDTALYGPKTNPADLDDLATETLSTVGVGMEPAHNNLQPYLAMNYIIALTGTYPS